MAIYRVSSDRVVKYVGFVVLSPIRMNGQKWSRILPSSEILKRNITEEIQGQQATNNY